MLKQSSRRAPSDISSTLLFQPQTKKRPMDQTIGAPETPKRHQTTQSPVLQTAPTTPLRELEMALWGADSYSTPQVARRPVNPPPLVYKSRTSLFTTRNRDSELVMMDTAENNAFLNLLEQAATDCKAIEASCQAVADDQSISEVATLGMKG